MIGKNLLWVSKQHGYSVQTMLSTYAAWIEGAKDDDAPPELRKPLDARRNVWWKGRDSNSASEIGGSVSCGKIKECGPLESPGIPGFGTGFVTTAGSEV